MSSDLGQHAAWIAEYADLGFDEVYLHHVGQEQRGFLDAFGEHVLPQLDVDGARSRRWRREDHRHRDLWWKNAVVYCLDVETFMDWDGDGMRRLRRAWPSGSTTSPSSASPACG